MLIEIEKTLTYLEDEFTELAQELQAGDWCNSEDDAIRQIIMVDVHQYQKNKLNERGFSLDFCSSSLTALYEKFDKMTNHALTYSSVLTTEELDSIVEMRNRDVSVQLKYNDGVANLLTDCGIREFFHNLIQLNRDIIKFHKDFRKRIYKR